ncbi:hypothetical protein [Candidatus Methylobacter favarea]|uniref:hypothetical protein n=1 Tax=Candidatus Methylobacter favarea TaxID=2707345 RepID=UPI00157C6EA9|nr:hypothetical protein [Candidatus Methylobacter favarea]
MNKVLHSRSPDDGILLPQGTAHAGEEYEHCYQRSQGKIRCRSANNIESLLNYRHLVRPTWIFLKSTVVFIKRPFILAAEEIDAGNWLSVKE